MSTFTRRNGVLRCDVCKVRVYGRTWRDQRDHVCPSRLLDQPEKQRAA